MNPITTIEEARRAIEEYKGEAADLKLPIADSLLDPAGVNTAILTDFILAKGFEPDGFEQKDGYQLFCCKEMDSDPFVNCKICGHPMVQTSKENISPLVMACSKCGHQEYALIQVSPPWSPEKHSSSDPIDMTEEENTSKESIFSPGLPVSVGEPGEETTIIPIGWVILWLLVLSFAGLIAWIIF